jgi:hypothetical protein
MAVTINGTTFNGLYLQKQPLDYETSDVTLGRSAKKWAIEGLITPSDWLTLLDIYDDFRDTKILEESPIKTGLVGTVVTFSCDGPGGLSWSNINCWFKKAPSTENVGAFLSVKFELIDASQGLELLQNEQYSDENDSRPDLGTITLGTTVLTLLKPVDAYWTNPSMEFTATGVHYITGNLVPYKIKDIEGTTNLTGWNNIRSWYESQISAVPLSGSYFPISAPSATAENKVVDGVTTVQYTVTIQLGLVI